MTATYLPLTRGKRVRIDSEDREYLSQFNWHTKSYRERFFYPARTVNGQTVFLHREILGALPKEQVDHKNGNTLDCRKENLRIATSQENNFNAKKRIGTASPFKGVSVCHRYQNWRAMIKLNGQSIHLGYFQLEKDAAKAYNRAAKKYFGDFAKLNKI